MFDRPSRPPATLATAQTKTAAIVSRIPVRAQCLPAPGLDVNDLVERVSMLMLRDPRPAYRRKA